ncbi:MAG: L-threonylcarbamoyladenylate synthase [Sumerlaeia bacterium]
MITPSCAESITRGAKLIASGELVAFPTETVYGLGANGLSAEAVEKIYAVKGRPQNNPLIFHVSSIGQARELVSVWPEEAERIAQQFWPGPLTLVLPVRSSLQSPALAGGRTIALRMPDHPVARQLLAEACVPIVAPSANRSGTLSPVTAQHVWENFHNSVPLILDGGTCLVGIESTVLDLCYSPPRILRPGFFQPHDLQSVLPKLASFTAESAFNSTAEPAASLTQPAEPFRSPGLLTRHYAPNIPLKLNQMDFPASSAALLFKDEPNTAPAVNSTWYLGSTPHAAESRLYKSLWEAQTTEGVTEIRVQPIPEGEPWDALRDRLKRAAVQ